MLALLLSATGCVLTPDKPNWEMIVRADRSAVADCVYLRLSERNTNWIRTDLPSVQTVRLTSANDDVRIGVIDFVSDGSSTRVVSRLHEGLQVGWTQSIAEMVRNCT